MFGASAKPLKPSSGSRPGARNRTVFGTSSVAFGMIAKNPGDNWKSWNMLVEQRKRDEMQRAQDHLLQQEKLLNIQDEFQKRTDKKRLMNILQHRVETGLKLTNHDAARRREKLRELLLAEEAAFAQEFISMAEAEKLSKIEATKRRAEEIRNQLVVEEKKLVEEKRLQQYMERNEEFRQTLNKKNRMEIRKAQELQMKDHERIRAQECEIESMWEAVARKQYESMVAREMEKAQRHFEKEKETATIVLMQKKNAECQNETERKRLRDEETAIVQKMIEDLKKEEELGKTMKKEKVEKRRRDLEEQMKIREAILNRMREEEKLMTSTFQKADEETREREQSARASNKEMLRREADMYLAYLEQLRKEKVEKNKAIEKLVQEETEKLDKQRMERQEKLKAASKRLQEEVLRERAEQLQWKLHNEEEQRRRAAEVSKLQKAILEQNARLEKEHEFEVRMMKKQYHKDLDDQLEYQKMCRERERSEIEREWRAGQLDEEHYTRLLKQLMEKRFSLRVHPFHHVINSSAHLTAEEPSCRCAPEIELGPEANRER